MADERKPLAARVTPAAHDGWTITSRVYGANATTLAQVIGDELARLDGPISGLPVHWRRWFAEAARLEREHRAGQGRKKN